MDSPALTEFTSELEGKLASMSDADLTNSLVRAGFELEDAFKGTAFRDFCKARDARALSGEGSIADMA